MADAQRRRDADKGDVGQTHRDAGIGNSLAGDGGRASPRCAALWRLHVCSLFVASATRHFNPRRNYLVYMHATNS
ncbi:hypothetical protein D3C86_1740460 [compost metagenome]